MELKFADIKIDTTRYEILRDGSAVSVEPLIFDLIVYLIKHAREVVSRDQLMRDVWTGKIVSDSTISTAIKTARKVLGDSGSQQKFIQTVHGRGFRWKVDVQSESTASVTEEIVTEKPHSGVRVDDKVSVVISPFVNLGGDPDETYFSDGITSDIIVALSQFQSIKVISGQFSRQDPRYESAGDGISGASSVDYQVEGTVQRSPAMIRISVQLIDTAHGEMVWAQKYDRELQDVFQVQDEVSRAIAATAGGRLQDHRARVTRSASENDLSVYDLILRAQEQHHRMVKSANNDALNLLKSALEIAPDSSRVHSMLGLVEQINYQMCWTEKSTDSLGKAIWHGREAVRLAPTDGLAHARLGDTLVLAESYQESEKHFDKALALNPNDSDILALQAEYLRSTGNPAKALEVLDVVHTYDPYDRLWYPWLRGEALFQLGQYQEAIAEFTVVTEPINDLRLTLAACYASSGEAQRSVELINKYLQVAQREMPEFPGYKYQSWMAFRESFAASRDQVYQLRMEALADVWPNHSNVIWVNE